MRKTDPSDGEDDHLPPGPGVRRQSAKRPVDLVVISDVHLGARGCRAEELLAYLKSIDPAEIILNGDIIDIWEFEKGFWPQAHMKVARRILKLAAAGVPVHYVIGNHDEALRAYAPFSLGGIALVDEITRDIGGRSTWIVHGDRIEAAMAIPRWISLLGTWTYDLVISANNLVNRIRSLIGSDRISFAQRVKLSLKGARDHIRKYEQTCARLAQERGYQTVITGHIHQARLHVVEGDAEDVIYHNSGDWVESLTALEFHQGTWALMQWDDATTTEDRQDLVAELEATSA